MMQKFTRKVPNWDNDVNQAILIGLIEKSNKTVISIKDVLKSKTELNKLTEGQIMHLGFSIGYEFNEQ